MKAIVLDIFGSKKKKCPVFVGTSGSGKSFYDKIKKATK